MAHENSQILEEKNAESFADSVVNAAVENNAENLNNSAKIQLENLLEQQKTFIKINSGLNIIKERYKINNSYITIAADWYGDKSWWDKLSTGILIVLASALIGAIFELGALFATIALTLNYAAAYILLNHNEATNAQKQLIEEDINKMEAQLETSVNAFNLTVNELNKTLKTLCELNIQLAGSEKDFKAQIEILEEKNGEFENTIQSFKTLTENLIAKHQTLIDEIQKANNDVQAINDEHKQEQSIINGIANNQSASVDSFNSSNNKLNALNDKFIKSITRLADIRTMITEYLNIVHNHEASSSREQQAILSKASDVLTKHRVSSAERAKKNNPSNFQNNSLFTSRKPEIKVGDIESRSAPDTKN